MNIPIHFPDNAEIIAEEAARFRALSPENRIRSIHGLLAAGDLMMRRSPVAASLREYTVRMENEAAEAIKEFIARHAG